MSEGDALDWDLFAAMWDFLEEMRADAALCYAVEPPGPEQVAVRGMHFDGNHGKLHAAFDADGLMRFEWSRPDIPCPDIDCTLHE